MSASELTTDPDYQNLLGRISDTYTAVQVQSVKAVNSAITDDLLADWARHRGV